MFRYKRGHALLSTVVSCWLPSSVWAVENGGIITPPGIFDFGSGMTPPPSSFGALGVRTVVARANVAVDGKGDASPVKPNLDINSLVFAWLKMTDADFLGGKYGFGLVVPTLDMRLTLRIPTLAGSMTKSGESTSVGDIQFLPVLVQWKPSAHWWANAAIMLQAPTGSYDHDRLINTGVNHWTLQPSFNFTYISPKGLEISGSTQVNFNSRNRSTAYRSGSELQQDFGIGQHVGPWIIGTGGYLYKQLTDDRGPSLVDGHRSAVFAFGPALGFVAPKSGLPLVFLHAYKEFRARNRAEGYQLALRVSWTL